MKNINPIQIWHKGEVKTASLLSAKSIDDNFDNKCVIYYQLHEAGTPTSGSNYTPPITMLAEGNCYMSEEVYAAWDGSNAAAYQFVAEQINVTIVEE